MKLVTTPLLSFSLLLLTLLSLALLAVLTLSLLACSDEVPMEVVDQNMIVSKNNAEMNARRFAKERYPNAAEVMVDSDSTIGTSCRYGDGWASGKIILQNGNYVEVKCQTNGRGKGAHGCLLKEEFIKKDYADEEGRCNKHITSLEKFK